MKVYKLNILKNDDVKNVKFTNGYPISENRSIDL